MSDKTTLLPCPFCGGEAFPNIELTKHWIECRECAAESGCYRTEAEAIAAWNTRADLKARISELEKQWDTRDSDCIALESKVNRLEDEIADWSELHAQVLSERNHVIAERDEWKAKLADMNAERHVETCRITASSTDGLCSDNPRHYFELSCGHSFTLDGLEPPNYCKVCGAKVIQGVDNAD